MILPPDPQSGKPSLMMIEGGLTLIVAAVAFGWPRIGDGLFARVERILGKLARKQGLAVVVVGMAALLLRLAILPVFHIPKPFCPDDFSFLLSAATFAQGRLTNPTPAMWTHFETIHVTMLPTYMSMYFPGQGLILAAAQALTGQPWYGLLLMSALMCSGICWMLQAWLPPTWAFLGGMLAVLHLGLFSYWINTYHAAGSMAALGGALVLGALPRFMKLTRMRYGLLMALGVVLLASTRPYEGILLCLPVGGVLAQWIFAGPRRPSVAVLLRASAAPLAIVVFAGVWMGYYNYRAFGSPLTLPYTVDRKTYALAPYFVWQSPQAEPVYRHAMMRRFYHEGELVGYEKIHDRFFHQTLIKGIPAVLFFAGVALLPLLLMLRRVLTDRRMRFFVLCMAIMAAGMVIQIFLIPHYLAPFAAIFYALGLQGMRHLRQVNLDGRPVGLGWVRLTVVLCVALVGVRLVSDPLHLGIPKWPASGWNFSWYGPENFGSDRSRVEERLARLPGKQLVIVRYSDEHNPFDEWVYNAPDIDGSKLIWAREMDTSSNLQLFEYYKDRKVWLVQPDTEPPMVTPYPMSRVEVAASPVTLLRAPR